MRYWDTRLSLIDTVSVLYIMVHLLFYFSYSLLKNRKFLIQNKYKLFLLLSKYNFAGNASLEYKLNTLIPFISTFFSFSRQVSSLRQRKGLPLRNVLVYKCLLRSFSDKIPHLIFLAISTLWSMFCFTLHFHHTACTHLPNTKLPVFLVHIGKQPFDNTHY